MPEPIYMSMLRAEADALMSDIQVKIQEIRTSMTEDFDVNVPSSRSMKDLFDDR